MNNILSLIVAVMFLQSVLHADKVVIEGKTAAYIPFSQTYKDLYGDVQACFEIDARVLLECFCVQPYASFDYLHGSGDVKCCDGKSSLDLYTFSTGVIRQFYFSECTSFYIGGGPTFGSLELNNNVCCIEDDSESEFSFGGVLKLGLYQQICEDWVVDLFVDYTYQKMDLSEKRADLSGMRIGMGLGRCF